MAKTIRKQVNDSVFLNYMTDIMVRLWTNEGDEIIGSPIFSKERGEWYLTIKVREPLSTSGYASDEPIRFPHARGT
jgi:hypothetical protein